MPKASSFSPWRLFTPIQLVFCIGLFFLPWIEIQCVVNLPPGGKADPFAAAMSGPKPILSQSGYQIAVGECTTDPQLATMMGGGRMFGEELGRGAGGQTPAPAPKAGGATEKVGSAPLMFAFPLFAAAGVVFGFGLGAGTARKLLLALCCVAAAGVIAGQMAIGFPVMKQVEEERAKNGRGGAMSGNDEEVKIQVALKVPLYVTFFFLAGATLTSFLDGGRPVPPPRRRDDDDRDSEDGHRRDREEDDDRPRRRAEDEDEDEDDRPRRRGR